MQLGQAMLLWLLRLPRQGRHLLPVPRSYLLGRSAMLWRARLYRGLLRRLPRPRGRLHQLIPVLLQRLHERRLPVGAGRDLCPRRRLPGLLPEPELHECLRQWRLYGLRSRSVAACRAGIPGMRAEFGRRADHRFCTAAMASTPATAVDMNVRRNPDDNRRGSPGETGVDCAQAVFQPAASAAPSWCLVSTAVQA